MKVGWSGIKYKHVEDLQWKTCYIFKVYTDSGDVILSAASVIDRIRYNKRRWRPDHIFWKADQYYKGDKFPDIIFPPHSSYFEVDPEKLRGRIKIKDNNNS